jgi:hypothetical protein
MKEKVIIETDNGILEIIGGKYDSALFLKGQMIQFTFLREIGSTWRYQIAKSISEANIFEDRAFSNFVKFGYLSLDPLSIQFDYIINKLGRGKYEIELITLQKDIYLTEFYDNTNEYAHNDTYGGSDTLIETQSEYDEQTINEFINLISKGNKPVMVLLSS